MAKVLDYNIVVSEFELQFTFGLILLEKEMNSLIPPSMEKIEPSLFLYKNGFGIK